MGVVSLAIFTALAPYGLAKPTPPGHEVGCIPILPGQKLPPVPGVPFCTGSDVPTSNSNSNAQPNQPIQPVRVSPASGGVVGGGTRKKQPGTGKAGKKGGNRKGKTVLPTPGKQKLNAGAAAGKPAQKAKGDTGSTGTTISTTSSSTRSSTSTTSSTSSSSTSTASTQSTSSSSSSAGSGSCALNSGESYSATITYYTGCGTTFGACGWHPSSGYTAAASQVLFASPGPGKTGLACGSCWLIHGTLDSSKQPIHTTDIVVTINNECPAEGNTPCAATSLTDQAGFSENGVPVNMDLCDESGAAGAFFGEGPGQKGMAYGRVTRVPCAGCWKGSGNETASWLHV